jgi:hypothetical protein
MEKRSPKWRRGVLCGFASSLVGFAGQACVAQRPGSSSDGYSSSSAADEWMQQWISAAVVADPGASKAPNGALFLGRFADPMKGIDDETGEEVDIFLTPRGAQLTRRLTPDPAASPHVAQLDALAFTVVPPDEGSMRWVMVEECPRDQCAVTGRASLQASTSERRHATARGPSRTRRGNCSSAISR